MPLTNAQINRLVKLVQADCQKQKKETIKDMQLKAELIALRVRK